VVNWSRFAYCTFLELLWAVIATPHVDRVFVLKYTSKCRIKCWAAIEEEAVEVQSTLSAE
jgi:hypothetical protein